MEHKHIKGSTYCIDTGMTYLPFYKITDTDIIVLDTGWAEGEREGLVELLDEYGYQVKGIICTHAHIDHIGNNAFFKEKYNALIAMSRDEARICSSMINLKMYYNRHTLTAVENITDIWSVKRISRSGKTRPASTCLASNSEFPYPGAQSRTYLHRHTG